jgi:hypothetical protein
MTPEKLSEFAAEFLGFDVSTGATGSYFYCRAVMDEGHSYDTMVILTEFWVDDFRDEIESWQGFGRTVEAMVKRKAILQIKQIDKYWPQLGVQFLFYGDCTSSGTFFSSFANPTPVKDDDIIEATHLAALEVVKDV